MASRELAESTAQAMASRLPHLAVVNFANGDVVGHSADRGAKVLAAEAVDRALARLADAARAGGYALVVTADHGVLETDRAADGKANRGHTRAEVPCWVSLPRGGAVPRDPNRPGSLKDVAPTVLSLLGLAVPDAMTGRPLYTLSEAPGRVLLVILDGWGLSEDPASPIREAATPCLDRLSAQSPPLRLAASGPAVGLQPDKPGNSEAGHLNIGAGRVVPQDDVRIAEAVASGALLTHPVLLEAFGRVRSRGGRTHVLGMLSLGSSHGTLDEAASCVRAASQAGAGPVFLHLVLDGRSTLPGSAPRLVDTLAGRLAGVPDVHIATAVGRAFALDRNEDWEGKTRVAYDALVKG
jgi:2,3-bisphosphoglycerate-independent phosphoglycerate mutase